MSFFSTIPAVLLAAFFLLAPVRPASAAGGGGSVDTNFDCYGCHSKKEITPWIARTWLESLHAKKGVKCPDCHGSHDEGFKSPKFTKLPGPDKCMPCHPTKVKETMASKHGGVTKCTSCHIRHSFSLKVAMDPKICMTCHQGSPHVQEYGRSKMGVVYDAEGPGNSATCQTCHMPDFIHNVGLTIEKKELMLKVCNQCHSASFVGTALTSGTFKDHW